MSNALMILFLISHIPYVAVSNLPVNWHLINLQVHMCPNMMTTLDMWFLLVDQYCTNNS